MHLKLYDYIRAHDPDSTWPDCPVIIADAIVAQIDALPLPLDYSPRAEEYGVVAPPFPTFFVEATSTHSGRKVQRGSFIEDVSDLSGFTTTPTGQRPPDTRWLLAVHGYMRIDDGELLTYPSCMYIHISHDGYILDDMLKVGIAVEEYRDLRDPRYLPPAGLGSHAPFTFKTINALHQRAEFDEVIPGRIERKKAKRRGIGKLSTYYVLKVRPSKPAQEFGDVGVSTPQHKNRHHSVRGHFRYYHPDRPGLGGRLVGAVWIPQHERGATDAGEINKDYRI